MDAEAKTIAPMNWKTVRWEMEFGMHRLRVTREKKTDHMRGGEVLQVYWSLSVVVGKDSGDRDELDGQFRSKGLLGLDLAHAQEEAAEALRWKIGAFGAVATELETKAKTRTPVTMEPIDPR